MTDTIRAYVFNQDAVIRNIPIKKGFRIMNHGHGWVIENGALEVMKIDSEVIERIKDLLYEEKFTEEVKYLKKPEWRIKITEKIKRNCVFDIARQREDWKHGERRKWL